MFHETLRLFPPVSSMILHFLIYKLILQLQVTTIPKVSAEDTTLVTTNTSGDKITVPIPKGSDVIIYTAGLHYNRKYSITFS